jgi:group I intron endonuclease
MVGIYKITNLINKKIYIGQSTDIEYRFNDYKRLRCKSQTKLYASLKKYGIENHKFEIITECDLEQLNNLERYYQDLYNVLDRKCGLNCKLTNSEDRIGAISNECKEKISNTLKRKYENGEIIHPQLGKKVSEKSRNKNSESQKKLYESGYQVWNKGKKMSDEARKNNSEAQKKLYANGYVHPNLGKKMGEAWNKGKKASENQKLKQSETMKNKYKNGHIPASAKMVIDLETGFVYYSAKEAWMYNKDYLVVGYDSFKGKLNGAFKNKTKFIYV